DSPHASRAAVGSQPRRTPSSTTVSYRAVVFKSRPLPGTRLDCRRDCSGEKNTASSYLDLTRWDRCLRSFCDSAVLVSRDTPPTPQEGYARPAGNLGKNNKER